jgi:tetratricopeptide (TPR) repeat protein
VRRAFGDADYVAVIEIKATDTLTVTREENIAVWNPRTLQSEPSTRVVREQLLVAEFDAKRIYKGERSVTQLDTPADPDACGVALKPGDRYLIYAFGPDDNNRVSTSQCVRTAPAEDSIEELEVLRSLTKPETVVFQPSPSEQRFNQAIDLIHLTVGNPDAEAIERAMMISDELARTDPLSGYSQALQAEFLSTWNLADNGQPVEVQWEILALTDESLRINPKLAQAHVARARTYMRALRLADAQAEIQAALRLAPQLVGAMFVQAEIYRRSGDSAKAADWMREYMVTTRSPVQKANGYEWLGDMWRDFAYHPEGVNRQVNLLMARSAYVSSTQLDPGNARRLVVAAAFLNEYTADFAAAESYATQALAVRESELARYHLAAARYQALQAKGAETAQASILASIAEISAATGVTLDQAVQYEDFHEVVRVRLIRLQRRTRPSSG